MISTRNTARAIVAHSLGVALEPEQRKASEESALETMARWHGNQMAAMDARVRESNRVIRFLESELLAARNAKQLWMLCALAGWGLVAIVAITGVVK